MCTRVILSTATLRGRVVPVFAKILNRDPSFHRRDDLMALWRDVSLRAQDGSESILGRIKLENFSKEWFCLGLLKDKSTEVIRKFLVSGTYLLTLFF